MSEPAGIVIPFAGSTAPQGYLLCDGSAVSRTDYADLFAAIGTVYGAGDGSTTFNLPDLSGRVVIGVSNSHALGSTGGEVSHVLTSSELPAHVHEVPSHGHANDITATTPELTHSITQPVFKYTRSNSNATKYWRYGSSVNNSAGNASGSRSTNAAVADHAATDCTVTGSITASDALTTDSYGTGSAHNNMQPYSVINYIISTGA
jgi:microcystin-dependent protein